MDFCDALKTLRGELGLTQTELAQALNVNYTTVSRWELRRAYPNRARLLAIQAFARSRCASAQCMALLEQGAASAKKAGLAKRLIERAPFEQLIQEASFPVYVCDYETDQLLYFNQKTEELMGSGAPAREGETCYQCLMHRSAPCTHCHKASLDFDQFKGYSVFRETDANTYRVQSRLILWNGRKAHAHYVTETNHSINISAQREREAAYLEQLRVRKQFAFGATALAHYNLSRDIMLDMVCEDERISRVLLSGRINDVFRAIGQNQFTKAERVKLDSIRDRDSLVEQFYQGRTHISIQYPSRALQQDFECTVDLMQNPVTFDIEAFVVLRDVTEATVAEQIMRTLLVGDYESIATIDVETGQLQLYKSGRLPKVMELQKQLRDNNAGVAEYLREHCADEDVERVIRETSMEYIKDQLEKRSIYSVSYSLRQQSGNIRKRAVYLYLNEQKTTLLHATQNITELYNIESLRRDQLASALQTLQEMGGMNVARYDLATKTFYSNSDMATSVGYGGVIHNVPEDFIEKGFIAPAYIDEYRAFFDGFYQGRDGTITPACRVADGSFHWIRVDARLLYDEDGKPYQAILSFRDVDEQREQAAVYQKWRQSFENRNSDDYTLFRCDLGGDTTLDRREGRLLRVQFATEHLSFNERTREYAGRYVHMDDFDAYVDMLNAEHLLAGYYLGKRMASMDYRERLTGEEYRWLHVTVETAQYPDSTDVEAFLMYEKSDKSVSCDPQLQARIDSDTLTGALNRSAFVRKLDELFRDKPQATHALMLADIDGFKKINEDFGHAAGDQALIEIAKSLREVVGEDGLIGRFGGDEFMVLLSDVPSQAMVEQKAMQILAALRRAYSVDIRMSASLGVAFYPSDGKDFQTLYHCVDMALYTAKSNGKDTFVLCGGSMMRQQSSSRRQEETNDAIKARTSTILLVDERPEIRKLVEETLDQQYRLVTCESEQRAMVYLLRYGVSLAAILLNLDNPSVDSVALLDRIHSLAESSFVPVIAMSDVDTREKTLIALDHGASDILLMPVVPMLLNIRVEAAVRKSENERLRAQNAYLQSQGTDAAQFRSVYENTGTVVVEYDWRSHQFVYDPSIAEHIAGRYDGRSLWQILMSDMVASVQDVKALQELILSLANERGRTSGTVDLMLKTPEKGKHWFTINAFRRVDERNLTSKIILTFLDVNEDILASKKLRFQAEHDSLTGLYNRASFLKLTEETVRLKPKDSYFLLCCDINDFRFFNERYGREEGDKLLQYSAEKLLVHCNAMSGFAGRLSSDIYALLLPNSPGIIDRARLLVEHFFDDYPLKAKITGRAGAYIVRDPSLSADAMLDYASTASDSIKGKFASWLAMYDDSMNEKRLREKSITDRMETALAQGQFDVYIQPQFHHATGQIVGAEALVRWIDPERGVISPAEFIPLFERNGFITRMDEYVWDKAAQYMSVWVKRGNKPVPLSVNVSREDIGDPELCQKLLAIVNRHGIPVDLFRLEITESLFAENVEHLTRVVEQLHNAGFLIEMDDFGSGYSSLNILKDVPVDVLKLDMKFFSGEDHLGRGGMIVNAVLRMSRWLDIPVIAEGVERRDQADFLMSIGCPTIQGYLYEKPMPAAAFETMLFSGERKNAPGENKIDTRLDAHSFWNPLSSDSQVFNHYIGPAAIFEYHKGQYELVRMNERFMQIMGIKETVILPAFGLVHIHKEDKQVFHDAVMELLRLGGDVKTDVRCSSESVSQRLLHITMRVIAKSDDRALIFAALDA